MQEHRATSKGSPVVNGKLDFHIRRTLVRAKGPQELAEEVPRFQSRQKHANIFKQANPEAVAATGLAEEHVKASRVYRMLEEQIASIISRHAQEVQELTQTLRTKERESEELSKQSHDAKVEVWELRNQIMEMQAELSREEEEYGYLTGGQPEEEKESESESRAMRTLGEGCSSDYSGTEG